jgi:lipid-A-disaccharide synthase-like uncharacterized protein
MVEYAVLVAQNTAGFFNVLSNDATSWASRLNWEMIGYVAVALVSLRLVAWVLKPSRY